jgi:hypothetical protein
VLQISTVPSEEPVKTRRPSELNANHDVSDPMAITGLSMAAQARPVTDATEVAKAMNLLVARYPEYAFPMPKPEEIAVYRVKGDFCPRLFERVWTFGSCHGLTKRWPGASTILAYRTAAMVPCSFRRPPAGSGYLASFREQYGSSAKAA